MELKYSEEKAVLILIALLKANGIKRVIVSPGTTNFTFVGSLQHDDFFELYSCVDERSAAYMACGMAEETGEPVVITCTGATAPRNYLPGLTEAYYRKLPVLAVCGHRGVGAIGHLLDQQLDRRNEPVDVANEQVWVPFVKDGEDEKFCYDEITKAILALSQRGGGPAMINLCTHYSSNMSVQELPVVRKVRSYAATDEMPALSQGRVAIMLGSHKQFSKEETAVIDAFCASNDAVVFCDHTSGYYGQYAVHAGLAFCQEKSSNLASVDLCISAGEVSGDDRGVLRTWAPITWRVSEDGKFRNRNNTTAAVFEMSLSQFCSHYIEEGVTKQGYLQECKEAYRMVYEQIPELPLSNIWIAKQLAPQIPEGASIYFGIFNSLRSWNLFELPQNVEGMCNVGGFGIDGTISSAIGRAVSNPNRLTYCVLGDLAFFYDMNALGNRYVGKNLRILLINNGLGDEFRMTENPAYRAINEEVRPYVAAEGHYGKKYPMLVKSYVETLGYKYLAASSKEEFMQMMPIFIDEEESQSMVFEVQIQPENDTEALDIITHIIPKGHESLSLKKRIIKGVKSVISEEKVDAIRTLLK